MQPSDTSAQAQRVYFKRLAEMTPEARVRVSVSLWQAAHSLQQSALRRKHPGASDPEIAFQIAVTRFGLELARAAWRR